MLVSYVFYIYIGGLYLLLLLINIYITDMISFIFWLGIIFIVLKLYPSFSIKDLFTIIIWYFFFIIFDPLLIIKLSFFFIFFLIYSLCYHLFLFLLYLFINKISKYGLFFGKENDIYSDVKVKDPILFDMDRDHSLYYESERHFFYTLYYDHTDNDHTNTDNRKDFGRRLIDYSKRLKTNYRYNSNKQVNTCVGHYSSWLEDYRFYGEIYSKNYLLAFTKDLLRDTLCDFYGYGFNSLDHTNTIDEVFECSIDPNRFFITRKNSIDHEVIYFVEARSDILVVKGQVNYFCRIYFIRIRSSIINQNQSLDYDNVEVECYTYCYSNDYLDIFIKDMNKKKHDIYSKSHLNDCFLNLKKDHLSAFKRAKQVK